MGWDEEWEAFYRSGGGNHYPDPTIIRFVARNYYSVVNRDRVRILDLGCGTGANLWFLSREGFDAYGIDGSESCIRRSMDKLNREKLTAHFKIGGFNKLPYENGYFDAVIDAASIQHNDPESIQRIVLEVYRVLKNGGKYFGMLIETDHNLSNKRFYTVYFEEQKVRDLFSHFVNIEVNRLHYTENDGNDFIRFLLIEGMKKETDCR